MALPEVLGRWDGQERKESQERRMIREMRSRIKWYQEFALHCHGIEFKKETRAHYNENEKILQELKFVTQCCKKMPIV